MSRSNLGSGQFTWTHVGQFVLERAGRQQKQVFWNNPKASATPHLWQVVNGPSDVVFYLDPEQGRAATLTSRRCKEISFQRTLRRRPASQETRRSSSPKNPMSGRRVNPPIPQRFIRQPSTAEHATDLALRKGRGPSESRVRMDAFATGGEHRPATCGTEIPHPIVGTTDDKGTAFTFTVTNWTALEEPLEVDASELSIKDPERTSTIAKEWAAEKKANSDKE